MNRSSSSWHYTGESGKKEKCKLSVSETWILIVTVRIILVREGNYDQEFCPFDFLSKRLDLSIPLPPLPNSILGLVEELSAR